MRDPLVNDAGLPPEFYYSLFSLSPDAILVLDPLEGRIQDCNIAAANMLGRPVDALQGLPLDQLAPSFQTDGAPSKDFLQEQITQAHKCGSSRFEWLLRPLDNADLWVDAHLKAVATGDKKWLLAVCRNIHAQKMREEQLRASEMLSRQLADTVPEILLVVDEGGRIQQANDRLRQILGYEPDELKGELLERLVPERFRLGHARMRNHYVTRESKSREIGVGRDLFALHRNGQEIPVEIVLAPLLLSENRKHVVASLADITERKNAERQLALFSTMIELAADPFYLVDVDDNCRMVYVNDAAARHFCAPREKIYRWRVPDWDPSFTEETLPELIETIVTTKNLVIESTHRTDRGELVPVQISINHYIDESGKNLCFGWFQDISRRQETERLMMQARERAEAASHAKSAFLANMSHEIRTPMNAVLGLTQLLLDTPLDTRQAQYLSKLDKSAKSLLGVLNDILDYSKIEADKIELESTPFSVAEIIENSINLFNLAAEEKGLQLLLKIAPDVPSVLVGDPLRLQQIINNLMGNAVKFTHSGSVQLSMRLLEASNDNVVLEIGIKDTGIGISPEQQRKLFKAFEQADTSTTRQYGGSGLGLSIARRLIEMMDGTITVVSEYGVGSQFLLTLKFQVPSLALTDEGSANLRIMRTLLLEADAGASALIEKMLLSWSFPVDVARSAEHCVQRFQTALDHRYPYDLIMLDAKVPEVAGGALLELLEEIQANHTGVPPALMIVITSISQGVHAFKSSGTNAVLERSELVVSLYDFLVRAQHNALHLSGAMSRQKSSQTGDVENALTRSPAPTPAKVLLVEDNATNQLVAHDLLIKLGYSVVIARNGLEAIERVSRQPFDVILMDLQMPQMDGLEAARRIRFLPGGETVPIIALTAAALLTDREASQAAGMNDFVAKPIDINTLALTLARWVAAGTLMQMPPKDESMRGELEAFSLPGFEFAAANSRLGGSWMQLRRVIGSFIKDFREVGASLDEYLLCKSWTEAVRVVHTVKGASLTIGARDLYNTCVQLEKELNEGAFHSVSQFKIVLADTLAALLALPEPALSPRQGGNLLPHLLIRIHEALAESRFVAPEELEELGSMLATGEQQSLLENLIAQVEAYHYSDARRTLNKLAQFFHLYLQ